MQGCEFLCPMDGMRPNCVGSPGRRTRWVKSRNPEGASFEPERPSRAVGRADAAEQGTLPPASQWGTKTSQMPCF